MKKNYFTKIAATLFSKRTGMLFFFLLIACIIWFISRVSNVVSAEVPVKICIYSSVNEQMPRMCSEEAVPVIVNTSGFSIIKQRANAKVVLIDVKNQKPRKKEDRSYMLLSSIQGDITQQLLKAEIKAESYQQDTIFFSTGSEVKEFFDRHNADSLTNQLE